MFIWFMAELSMATLSIATASPPARTVAVWWKPSSLSGIPSDLERLRTDLAATQVLVYCGYAALPNGSFGVSPIAAKETWGNISLCEPAISAAEAAGLSSQIIIEGRAGSGFEAAVGRGGAAFGQDVSHALRAEFGGGQYPGLHGVSFDFEHEAGTHGRVNVSARAYASFLRGVSGELPFGLRVSVCVDMWPFMSNFSLLTSPTGGNASAGLFDMALYHGENASQWDRKLNASIANIGPSAPTGALSIGLMLKHGGSSWEATPTSVRDRFDAIERRGVSSVAIFEFSHGDVPRHIAPEMMDAWTAALHRFVQGGGSRRTSLHEGDAAQES
jgi:hypothetical protein